MTPFDGPDDWQDDEDPWTGAVEETVRAELAALVTAHPMADALRAMAIHLAHKLDHADAQTVAGISKELRATIDALTGLATTDAAAELDRLLSTPTPPAGGPDPAAPA